MKDNYYIDQLRKINADEYGIKIKVTCTDSYTNWLSLNLDSIEALQAFLEKEKNRLIDALPVSHMKLARRKHNTGIAIANLLNAKRSPDDFTVFNTPIGTKTPTGIYETVKAILADNPEYPRYEELFPEYKVRDNDD